MAECQVGDTEDVVDSLLQRIEDLEATVSNLTTANEDFHSVNKELVTSNGELRQSNAELKKTIANLKSSEGVDGVVPRGVLEEENKTLREAQVVLQTTIKELQELNIEQKVSISELHQLLNEVLETGAEGDWQEEGEEGLPVVMVQPWIFPEVAEVDGDEEEEEEEEEFPVGIAIVHPQEAIGGIIAA